MTNEKSFIKIINAINESTNILILPHILPDGDTIGSAVALYDALLKVGKKVSILTEGDVPAYLDFLIRHHKDDESVSQIYDLCIAVDCSDLGRLGKRNDIFNRGQVTVNIDHHATNDMYANINYVDKEASATGEIIFELIQKLKIDYDTQIAEAIYSAISTDTGSFKYSNTSSKTHRIAAVLLDMGIDINKINVEIYQNTRLEKIKLEAEVLKTLTISCEGKVASAFVTQQMLDNTGATMEETEGLIEILRNIQGVEVAVLLKEMLEGETKVGLRAKGYSDVSQIAAQFGGGGHVKAAGCTIKDTVKNAKILISEAIESSIRGTI